MTMRLLLVVGVLVATPGFAQSLPGQQVSRLALLAGEDAPKLPALPPPPPATLSSELPEDPFTPLYQRILSMQLRLLELQRVSLAGPLSLTMIGGTALLAGLGFLLVGFISSTSAIIGLLLLAGASLPLIIGIPWLAGNLATNGKIDSELEKVQLERRQLGGVSARRITQVDGALLAVF